MEADTATPEPAYPVTYDVEHHVRDRNRLTVGFRLILAIPQLLMVGGPGVALGFGWGGGLGWLGFGAGSGALGAAAMVSAIISWFAIVFTGKQPRGLWDLTNYYMRWRANAVAYTALLRDEYPPFSTGESEGYPVSFDAGVAPEQRNRWSVGFRIILAIPHILILIVLGLAWLVTAIIGWFAMLFTGNYPEGLYKFAIGYLRWALRVQAYVLLMQDRYPPFSLE